MGYTKPQYFTISKNTHENLQCHQEKGKFKRNGIQ